MGRFYVNKERQRSKGLWLISRLCVFWMNIHDMAFEENIAFCIEVRYISSFHCTAFQLVFRVATSPW